jgi:hypothetical protein
MRNKANFAQPAGRPIPRGKTCKTNPIRASRQTHLGSPGKRAKQTQFSAEVGRDGARGTRGAVQTNPIPAIMPIRRSAFPGGQLRQTKPIRPCGPEGRDRMCETNPILRRGRAGRGPGDEGCCTNKPNPAIMPIRRSAFPGGQLRQTKPIRPRGPEGRDRMCETNPIRASPQIHLGESGASGGHPGTSYYFEGRGKRVAPAHFTFTIAKRILGYRGQAALTARRFPRNKAKRRGGSGGGNGSVCSGTASGCFGRVGCNGSRVSAGSFVCGVDDRSLRGVGSAVRKITRARKEKRPGTSGGSRNQEGEAVRSASVQRR